MPPSEPETEPAATPEPKAAPEPVAAAPQTAAPVVEPEPIIPEPALAEPEPEPIPALVPKVDLSGPIPFPSVRQQLPADLEDELEAALRGESMESLFSGGAKSAEGPTLEAESVHQGRVVAIRRDDVFLELGGREQGVIPIRQMPQPPNVGDTFAVIVQRFNSDEGLYELSLPNVAASVVDWGDLTDGMLVEAKITGHNTGGLECEVNHVRGFIPISQISLYRVENLEEFVGQQMLCLVTEANRDRRNLVLSRRALLEREREESKQRLWDSLAVGQIYDGVVRKLMDFGAFVDIGGMDGLLHVSQLSWARVKHPSEVLQEGQAIRVRIEKLDPAGRKISFGYRDMIENPWTNAAGKYAPNSVVSGKVTRLMDFGAFVELEPGIEGLVHISELSPKRVWRASDVVQPGQEVDVFVLSVDSDAKRMSLSMRALAKAAEPEKKTEPEIVEAAPPPTEARKKPTAPLKGGLGRAAGGDRFGLKW